MTVGYVRNCDLSNIGRRLTVGVCCMVSTDCSFLAHSWSCAGNCYAVWCSLYLFSVIWPSPVSGKLTVICSLPWTLQFLPTRPLHYCSGETLPSNMNYFFSQGRLNALINNPQILESEHSKGFLIHPYVS